MNNETHRRPHLTKEQRLPQSYKEVEKILNKVKRCEANVKTALNNSKLRGAVLHKVSGLTFSVLKQSQILDLIIDKIQILEKEPYMRKELAGILIHELIFGNGLPGKSKPVETILKYQTDIERAYDDIKSDDTLTSSLISIPKYVRVNTLVLTLSEVLEDLEYLGVRQIIFESDISEEEFYKLVKDLEKNTFLLDYHFKDLLIFHAEENLTSWSLYKKGCVFIQDKSSYIPAYVLNPPPGASVIDACAAPGMKTLHLTALMENNGTIYAFERDQNRFEILNNMLESGHASICQTSCGDFNSVDPKDEKYSSVEYILLDPSCSGSGMVSRMDCITDTKESKNDLRIQKLAGFQIILLKHALLFPSVKRVVYSTCSVTEAENEFVVHEVLNHFSHRFKLTPVLPDWPIRGSSDFEFGSHCLRAYPDKCLTNGFFVAMFERLEGFEEQFDYEKKRNKYGKGKCDNDSRSFQKESKFCNSKESFDNEFSIDDQFVKEERNYNNSQNNVKNKAADIMTKKNKHKKDKLTNVKVESIEEQAEETVTMNTRNQNNSYSLNVEETKPLKKKHKSKRNTEYSDSNLESDNVAVEPKLHIKTNESSANVNKIDKQNQKVQNRNSDISEVLHKRKKHSNSDSCFIETDMSEVLCEKTKCEKEVGDSSFSNIQNFNVENNTLAETPSEVMVPCKKKKHKRKHNQDDFNGKSQTTEFQISQSNKDSMLTESVLVETVYKTKKKHKRKHEKEDHNNSFCETQMPAVQISNTNVEGGISKQLVQDMEVLKKVKKKHKRKHD